MSEGKPKLVKEEESGEDDDGNALDAAAPTPKTKPASKEEPIDLPEDEDNVPLGALSKAKKKKKKQQPGKPSKVKKEEPGGEEDGKSPKGRVATKEAAATSNGEPSEVKEEEPHDDEEKTEKARTQKTEGVMSNGKPLREKREETQESEEEEEEEEEGERSDKRMKLKKEAVKSNDEPAKLKKQKTQDSEEMKPQKGKIKKKKKAVKNNGKPSKVKKEEPKDEEEEKAGEDKKTKKKKKVMEEKVVGKASKVTVVQGKVKREKKVYSLPGQKHDPPEERDPLRIFYETLYEQVPTSEMASFWMLEWGLLPLEEAKKVYEKKVSKSQQQKLGSPVKAVSVKKTASVTVKKVKITSETMSKTPKKRKGRESNDDAHDLVSSKKIKKRKGSDSDDDDDDFVLSKKIKKRKVST